jgi:hypothetical protein
LNRNRRGVTVGVGEAVGFAVGVCFGVGEDFSGRRAGGICCAVTDAPKLKPSQTIANAKKPMIFILLDFLFIKVILPEDSFL